MVLKYIHIYIYFWQWYSEIAGSSEDGSKAQTIQTKLLLVDD